MHGSLVLSRGSLTLWGYTGTFRGSLTRGSLALLGFNSILGVGFIDTLGVHWRFAGFTGTFWGSLTLWGYTGTLVFTGILGVHRHFGSMARLLASAQLVLLAGKLNTLAAVVTVFYLVAYAAVDLSCLSLEWASAPNFR